MKNYDPSSAIETPSSLDTYQFLSESSLLPIIETTTFFEHDSLIYSIHIEADSKDDFDVISYMTTKAWKLLS